MKKNLVILSLFIATGAYAQKDGLKKGQEVSVITTTDQTIDMGMQMKNRTKTTYKMVVLEAGAKDYTVATTLSAIKLDGDMMGQPIAYDSDKKEDRESPNGKQFESTLNKTDTVLLDVKTGTAKPLSPEKDDETNAEDNMLQGMMNGAVAGSSSMATSSIYFFAPVELKAGNKWVDSSLEAGMKTITNYNIESITNGIATINTNGTVEGTTAMDLQGQAFEMKMSSKMNGSILLDTRTGLVKKRNNVADVEGSMDVMGQSMPFTSKTTVESVYK